MTTSRRLDDRNVEARRAWLAPRRVVACTLIAVAVAAAALIGSSLQRSMAQLGAAVPTVAARSEAGAVAEPPTRQEPAIPSAEPPARAELLPQTPPLESEAGGLEPFELEAAASSGPLTGAEFAELVESGAFGDVDVDAAAIAEMRRALDAAAREAELETEQP